MLTKLLTYIPYFSCVLIVVVESLEFVVSQILFIEEKTKLLILKIKIIHVVHWVHYLKPNCPVCFRLDLVDQVVQ
jgi:hypothetical protein